MLLAKKLQNTKICTVIENIEQLINYCIPSSTNDEIKRQEKWFSAVHYYKLSMIILRKKNGEYTASKLRNYQEHTGIFGNLWIDLHQERGMTNYIHLIVSGHVYEYMLEWRNRYRFSKQGWESLNSLVKQFFP